MIAQQFGLNLSEDLSTGLAGTFASANGRDIKGFAKLVARFSLHHKCCANIDLFKHCATLRALEYVD